MEAAGRIVDQVPDDDEDGSGHGDEGFEFAAAFDQASAPFAEEGVGPGRGSDGGSERSFEARVALPGLPLVDLAPDWPAVAQRTSVRGAARFSDTRFVSSMLRTADSGTRCRPLT